MSATPTPYDTLLSSLVKLYKPLENFTRKVGSWVVVLNNFVHAFHISNVGTLNVNAVLTAISGAILYADHQSYKSA